MKLSFSQFSKGDNFLIIIHQKPDGDCLGAALAFSKFLNQLGKNNQIIVKDRVPEKLKYLPQSCKIAEFTDGDFQSIKKEFDVVIFLDCASLEMSGFYPEDFLGKKTINIDHHPTNPKFGDVNLLEAESAATCEILFDLFEEWEIDIDKEMAIDLFSGIFTDTGGFQHSNTTLAILKKAATLQSHGINVGKISKIVFNTKSIESLKSLGLALSRLRYNKKYNLVYSVITKKDQERLGTTEEDLEGIAFIIAKCPDINVAMFLHEVEGGKIKGSLKTEKEEIDVSALAGVLMGGGHKKASGFKLSGRIIKEGSYWLIK